MIKKLIIFITAFCFIVTNSIFSLSLAQTLSAPVLSKDSLRRAIKSFNSTDTSRDMDMENGASLSNVQSMMGTSGDNIYYNIHVLGQVKRPGTFKILPSDRVSDALRYGGGVLPNGSQRFIQLRRGGIVKNADIEAYKTKGLLDQNPYLMENDVIFVPVKEGEIQIEGPVARPGYYEISRPISLLQGISMAGGFVEGRSLKEPVRVIRFNKMEDKDVLAVENTDVALRQFTIRAGDIIVIPHILIRKKKFDYAINRIPGDNLFYPTINNNVYVTGAVLQPGAYPFQPSFTYKDYVSIAGPTQKSSVRRSKVIFSNGKKKGAQRVKEINPGDTIVVPEKAVTVMNTLQWINTLNGLALSSFFYIDRFGNN